MLRPLPVQGAPTAHTGIFAMARFGDPARSFTATAPAGVGREGGRFRNPRGTGGSGTPLFVCTGCALRIPGVPRFPASVHMWPQCPGRRGRLSGSFCPCVCVPAEMAHLATTLEWRLPLRALWVAVGHICAQQARAVCNFSRYSHLFYGRAAGPDRQLSSTYLQSCFFKKSAFAWRILSRNAIRMVFAYSISIRKMAAPLGSCALPAEFFEDVGSSPSLAAHSGPPLRQGVEPWPISTITSWPARRPMR